MPLTKEFRKSRAALKALAVNRFDPKPTGAVAAFVSRSLTSLTVNDQAYTAASPQYTWNSGNLSMIGGNPVVGGSYPNSLIGITRHVNYGTIASPTMQGNMYRWRFRTAAPQLLIHTLGSNGSGIHVCVDGAWTGLSGNDLTIDAYGELAVSQIDLGAWPTNQEAAGLSITAGGTDYARGDIITLVGGTGTALTAMVSAVTSGAVSGLSFINRGDYSATPSSPAATTSTGGGTGLTLTPTWVTKFGIKNRLIELYLSASTKMLGVSVGPDYTCLPVPASGPRFAALGDSQSEASFNRYNGGQWWAEMCRSVGIEDSWGYAVGGQGWATASGYLNRIPDIIANGADIVWATGSSNDGAVADATITAAVYAGFKALRTGLPNALLIGSSPWNSPGVTLSDAKNAAVKAGIDQANADGADIKWIDTKAWTTNGRYIGGGSGTGSSSWKVGNGDSTHYSQPGHSENAQLAAEALRSILATAA